MTKLYSILLLVLLTSGQNIKYGTTFEREKKVRLHTVIHDIPAMTLGFFILTDSFMITQDMRATKNFMKLMDYRQNSFNIEFGNTGRGPQELPTPKFIGITDDGDTFLLYDPNLKKVHYCYSHHLDCKPYKVVDLKDADLAYIFDARPVNDNFIIATGLFKNGPFASINRLNNNEVKFYNTFPFTPKGIDPYLLSELNKGSIRLSPSKEYLIFSTINFGYISCYKIEDNKIDKMWEHWITEPKYDLRNGNVYLKNENILGFMDIAVTDEHVYAIYHGKEMHTMRSQQVEDNPETIMKFSLAKGTPMVKYRTDKPIIRIAVNPDNEVYCIAKPLGYDLVKVEID